MHKELIIAATPQETKLAILENDELVEYLIERRRSEGIVGNIYKGKVTKVLPGMQSAFVDIGLERDAFLYVSDFFEDAEEYDKLVSTAEDEVVASLQEQRAAQRSAAPATPPPAVEAEAVEEVAPELDAAEVSSEAALQTVGNSEQESVPTAQAPSASAPSPLLEGEVRNPR